VGERGEVAGCPEGTDLRDRGGYPGVQEFGDRRDEHRSDAASSGGEGPCAEQLHRPDDLAVDRRADPGGVAVHERLLDPDRRLGGDPVAGEGAEPGSHPVDVAAVGDRFFDDPE
jgi:hypothetical protein